MRRRVDVYGGSYESRSGRPVNRGRDHAARDQPGIDFSIVFTPQCVAWALKRLLIGAETEAS
jgi:hypothetical protein